MSLRLRNRIKKNTLIAGYNGDDLFGGTRYLYADLISEKKFTVIAKKILTSKQKIKAVHQLLHFGIRPLLPASIKRLYRKIVTLETQQDEYGLTHDDVNHVDDITQYKNCKLFRHQSLSKLVYYRNTPENLYYTRKSLYFRQKLAAIIPYYSKQMIEFMWTVPIEFLESNGNLRAIQLNALKQVGLNHICKRTDKTGFTLLTATGLNRNIALIKKITASSILLSNGIIDSQKVQDLTNKISSGPKDEWLVFPFIQTEIWWRAIQDKKTSFGEVFFYND